MAKIDQILAPFDSFVLVLEAIDEEVTGVETCLFVCLDVMVAPDEVGLETFPHRVVLDDIAGLVLPAKTLHELLVISVDIPAV